MRGFFDHSQELGEFTRNLLPLGNMRGHLDTKPILSYLGNKEGRKFIFDISKIR
ncbi:hypothetical protein MFUM_970022 [Methylacidiphilum fumariolicum SolV]|uniref:Uncharacterized protein n=2 Tax=Candidatus Methylacidiphilum fumarolicum TaxID=591154 RepID=I0K184_METFB|nr:conserved protein of unknown function [Candidatus Methylacidiphilum fumarolicum]CCG93253.1 hypothetical protein MFUM_970022 [Methylacidiphilum fumariolicum SolV]